MVDFALDALQGELWPNNTLIADPAFAANWVVEPAHQELLQNVVDHLRGRRSSQTLKYTCLIAEWSAASTLIWIDTNKLSHAVYRDSLLVARSGGMFEGVNALLHAVRKSDSILPDKAAWNGSAAAKVYLMEKTVTWISILTTRVRDMVLPDDLVNSEVYRDAPRAVAALISRNWGRYSDENNYWRDRKLRRIRDGLLNEIFGLLTEPQVMCDFA